MKIELSEEDARKLAEILKVYAAITFLAQDEESTISTVLGKIDNALEQEKE